MLIKVDSGLIIVLRMVIFWVDIFNRFIGIIISFLMVWIILGMFWIFVKLEDLMFWFVCIFFDNLDNFFILLLIFFIIDFRLLNFFL